MANALEERASPPETMQAEATREWKQPLRIINIGLAKAYNKVIAEELIVGFHQRRTPIELVEALVRME